MDAVESRETVRITRHGVEVAELRPIPRASFAPLAELRATLAGLPTGGHDAMRAEADAVFGEDRIGG